MLVRVSQPATLPDSATEPKPVRTSRRVGRPAKPRLAFAMPARSKNRLASGVTPRVFLITEMELSEILALCRVGTDPMTATIKILGVSDQTFKNWRNESQRDDCDERYKIFFEQVGQAFAECRADASVRVTKMDPLAALTRGPLGRSQPGYPGWTETHEVRHTDHTGDGPATLRVKIVIGRLGIKSEVIEDARRLTEGNETDGE